jgi:RNA polymerase sigma factor (sigma-70 family)
MPDVLPGSREPATLAERIRAGDPAAEEELVRSFSQRLFVLALVRTRDAEGASDLRQDALLAALDALRKGHLRDSDKLAGFVYGVARNVINNHLRARAQVPRGDSVDPSTLVAATAADPLETAERKSLVRQAIARLEPGERRILKMTLTEGLTPSEIGARLGLTSELVRQRKSRALKKVVETVKRLSRC